MTPAKRVVDLVVDLRFVAPQWPQVGIGYPYRGERLHIPLRLKDKFYDCVIFLRAYDVTEIKADDLVRVGICLLDPQEVLKIVTVGDRFTLGFTTVAEGTVVSARAPGVPGQPQSLSE